MLYVQQQRINEVQILVISENTFKPRTMNFTVKRFLCILFIYLFWILDNLPQIQARIIQKMTENRFMFVFLVLHSTFGVYVVV